MVSEMAAEQDWRVAAAVETQRVPAEEFHPEMYAEGAGCRYFAPPIV